MFYLIGEIVICLLAAAVLGFIIGWLLRGFSARLSVVSQPQLAVAGAGTLHTNEVARGKTSGRRDDLKEISGIGKFLEARLNSLDVFTFQQIANWDESDIRYISSRIGPFKGRIERDNWVEQARRLQNSKHDDAA